MIVTNELIERGKSERGGWTRKQLACLGVEWPPHEGWKQRVVGSTISDEAGEQFVMLAGAKKKRNKPGSLLAALESLAKSWEQSGPGKHSRELREVVDQWKT